MTQDHQTANGEPCDAFGVYVYGVVAVHNGEPTPDLPRQGIDPTYPVYVLSHKTTQAIVSRVSLALLQRTDQDESAPSIEDMKWLADKVRAHEGILEAVLASRTVIPMRFCAVFRSEGGVQDMLSEHYDQFVEALERLDGKKEWGVRVWCNPELLEEAVEATSAQVRALRNEMASKSKGTVYFLNKRLRTEVAAEAERISDECAQRSHDRLTSHAAEARLSALRARRPLGPRVAEATGRREEMILNGVYLVADRELPAFRAELESLEREYCEPGFTYEVTGPWPPYNFVTIHLGEGVTT